jgi:putative ABC transport system ATP-binding protein
MTIIKTENLAFENFIFYDDIEIKKDAVTFITGASGTGKSTLFRLINRTAKKSNGSIFFEGISIDDIDPITLRKSVMLIGQDPYLFDGDIKANFASYYSYLEKNMPSDDDITSYLHLLCLDFPLDKNCSELSGGEKQRLFIAIHLSLKPKVILLDEPTSALDQKTCLSVMDSIISYAKTHGITLLVISHNQAVARAYSQYTVRI